MSNIDDGPDKSGNWYADDFETTTDLDGEPYPYTLTPEEAEAYADLEPGESQLTVLLKTKDRHVTETETAVRHPDGSLTATRRAGRVRVWSWAIRAVEGPGIWRGTDIAGYVEKAAELGGVHWFHNLRFDSAFLDTYLQDIPPFGLNMDSGKWFAKQVPQGCFGALISDTGAHYARYVHLQDGRRFEVRDSLKKFPATTVAMLAGMYEAPSPKGEIDYNAPRPEGYMPTREEWSYIETDVEIVATALRAAKQAGAEGLTIGGDALNEFKRTSEHGRFRSVFPLLDRDTDDFIRRAYRGGWTYVNPLHQGKILDWYSEAVARFFPNEYGLANPAPGWLKKLDRAIFKRTAKRATDQHLPIGEVFDVNSMYPAVMHQESFPVGAPVWMAPGQTAVKGHPHTIVGALFDATIRPGKLPILQIKKDARYNPVQYQTTVRGVQWYGTEVDWKLLYENYNVDVFEWLGGIAFKGKRQLFNRYIDKWMAVKSVSKGGARAQAKFQLNNLWGRFAINPLRAARLPALADDGTPLYQLTSEQYDEPCYTAVGVWTTSYGRDRVIRAAQSFGDAFLSADTDSVHKLGIGPGTLEVHDTKLGAWKRESTFTRATYLRAKAYAEEIDGKVEAHVAGVPRKLLDNARVEDIRVGTRYTGKLVPKRVPGGVILESTHFVIGVRDAWGHRS